MSSPLAHADVGYLVYQPFRRLLPADKVLGIPARLAWPLAAIGLSLVPDLDVAVAWALGSLERFHNNLTHSLLAALAVSLLLTPPLRWLTKAPWKAGFGFILACYVAHVGVDWVTHGRGVMLFWPFTTHRFLSPVTLFPGVPWASGLTDPLYRQMLIHDGCFAVLVILLVELIRRRRALGQ